MITLPFFIGDFPPSPKVLDATGAGGEVFVAKAKVCFLKAREKVCLGSVDRAGQRARLLLQLAL